MEEEKLFEEIWLSDNSSTIFFSKQKVDSYLDLTLDDEDHFCVIIVMN